MLKILQASLQQYVNFQMFKLELEKADESEIKLPTSIGSYKKHEHSRKQNKTKQNYFCFTDYTKVFDCVDNNTLWKILRDGNTRPLYLPPDKPVCRSRSNS